MKIEGKITILCDGDKITIELHDDNASLTFAKVELTPKQFSQALGRLAHTECKSMDVRGLDRIGTVMENKEFIFEVPEDLSWKKEEREKVLIPILEKHCPEGWLPDIGFNSQNSFFKKNEKSYARTTIRRWVKKPQCEKE